MTLEERVQKKIEQFIPLFEQIPGVVIIHYLYPTSTVLYMTQSGLKHLNTTIPELQEMGSEYYDRFFNPEDVPDYVPKVLGLLERNNGEETVSFFQQVRPSAEHDWQWHVCGTRIFMRDDEGNPYLTISVAIPIDPKHYFSSKLERLLEENAFLKKHSDVYATLSKREKEILSLMARDKTSGEIADQLFVSEDTIKTHRRNIKKKIGAQNYYDVVRFAQAFGLI